MKTLKLSNLHKTWLIDIDGVIFEHNYYLKNKEDKLVDNVLSFLKKISKKDKIILLTSREEKYKSLTIRSLKKYKIRYDYIIFNLPTGERILINDIKPNGLKTAICLSIKRNNFRKIKITFDQNL